MLFPPLEFTLGSNGVVLSQSLYLCLIPKMDSLSIQLVFKGMRRKKIVS